MTPLNARMKSTSLTFRRSGVQSHVTLGSAEAIQSEHSLEMVCWFALCEKRSECFLGLVGPYPFGEHLVLEFHPLLVVVHGLAERFLFVSGTFGFHFQK
jgi:hypothetical protein